MRVILTHGSPELNRNSDDKARVKASFFLSRVATSSFRMTHQRYAASSTHDQYDSFTYHPPIWLTRVNPQPSMWITKVTWPPPTWLTSVNTHPLLWLTKATRLTRLMLILHCNSPGYFSFTNLTHQCAQPPPLLSNLTWLLPVWRWLRILVSWYGNMNPYPNFIFQNPDP